MILYIAETHIRQVLEERPKESAHKSKTKRGHDTKKVASCSCPHSTAEDPKIHEEHKIHKQRTITPPRWPFSADSRNTRTETSGRHTNIRPRRILEITASPRPRNPATQPERGTSKRSRPGSSCSPAPGTRPDA